MNFVLVLHNLMRWLVLLFAIYALYRMYSGLFQKRDFVESDRKSLSWFSIALDIQLLLGLVLYVANGWWRAFQNMSSAMGQSSVRFFAVEHIMMMVVAVILAHLASVFAKRAQTSSSKFVRGAIFATLAVLAILLAIPWPWMGDYGRPLFRLTAQLLTGVV